MNAVHERQQITSATKTDFLKSQLTFENFLKRVLAQIVPNTHSFWLSIFKFSQPGFWRFAWFAGRFRILFSQLSYTGFVMTLLRLLVSCTCLCVT